MHSNQPVSPTPTARGSPARWTMKMKPLDLDAILHSKIVTDEDIIISFAKLMTEMRKRGIIRTKNVVGDLGERYAVHVYRTHIKRPISLSGTNSTDVDATDANGLRYSIKAASQSTTKTSAFHLERERNKNKKAFDALIIVRVDSFLQPTKVYEFTWKQFWTMKQWSTRQKAWFMPLSNKVLKSGQLMFSTTEEA